jgi:predicted Ser/Thr protein kinase
MDVGFRPGVQVGPYALVEELGRGGMGLVFRARHVQLGRWVALKVLLDGAADDEARRRFEVEARAAGALRHPGIVPVHDLGFHGRHPYFAMELVDGEALDAVLKRDGPLDPAEAARVARDVAQALGFAHGQQVLHRDLKPANVLRTREGRVLLADFGLAKRLDASYEALTKTGVSLGTPAFMPPEQADGDAARIGPRSDVYGLGATLYALLTGRPPFAGATALNILNQVFSKRPDPPSAHQAGVPRDLDVICQVCLEKEPEDRYPSAQALADDLARHLGGEPISARPISRGERVGRQVRRRQRLILGSTATAAIALAGLGAWGSTGGHAREAAALRKTLGQALKAGEVPEDLEALAARHRELSSQTLSIAARGTQDGLDDSAQLLEALRAEQALAAMRSQGVEALSELRDRMLGWLKAPPGTQPDQLPTLVAGVVFLRGGRAAAGRYLNSGRAGSGSVSLEALIDRFLNRSKRDDCGTTELRWRAGLYHQAWRPSSGEGAPDAWKELTRTLTRLRNRRPLETDERRWWGEAVAEGGDAQGLAAFIKELEADGASCLRGALEGGARRRRAPLRRDDPLGPA